MLEFEKVCFHSVGLAKQSNMVLASATVQTANTKLAQGLSAPTLLAIADDGKYMSKYKENVPKADKMRVGRKALL